MPKSFSVPRVTQHKSYVERVRKHSTFTVAHKLYNWKDGGEYETGNISDRDDYNY